MNKSKTLWIEKDWKHTLRTIEQITLYTTEKECKAYSLSKAIKIKFFVEDVT